MKGTPTGGAPRRPVDTVRAIAWPDYDADLRLTQKTRRAVRDAVITGRERRLRQLRVMGFALIGFLFLMVLLAPALWNSLEDLLAGEHFFDLPALVALLTLMLFPPLLAALIALWKGKQDVEHDRGGFDTFRPIEK
jgi:hypothetical protein